MGDKVGEKLAFIALLMQKSLEVINNDILILYSRIREEAAAGDVKKIGSINQIQVNYTSAFLAFNMLSLISIRFSCTKPSVRAGDDSKKGKTPAMLREFLDNVRIFVNALKFFSEQFDQKTSGESKELRTYRDVIRKLELLSKDLPTGADEPAIVIGGFEYDRDERRDNQHLIPGGGRHALWLDKLRAKYDVLQNEKDPQLIRNVLSEILPLDDPQFERIHKFTIPEAVEYWSAVSNAAEPLTAQLRAAAPVLTALGEYAQIPVSGTPLEFVRTALEAIRQRDRQEILDEANATYTEMYSALDLESTSAQLELECSTILARTGVLLERHNLLASLRSDLNAIDKLHQSASINQFMEPIIINVKSDIADSTLDKVKQIIHLNSRLAPLITSREELYRQLATQWRSVLLALSSLISKENKLTCIRNSRLIVRALLRSQLLQQLLQSRWSGKTMKEPQSCDRLQKLFNSPPLYDPTAGLLVGNIEILAEKIC